MIYFNPLLDERHLQCRSAGVPATYARNILIANGLINYQEPIILPDTSLKSGKKIKFRGITESNEGSLLIVYPNPAHNYFIVKFKLGNLLNQGTINMYDENGRIVLSRTLTGKQDQVIVPVSGLNPGIYILVLEDESKRIESKKVTIIK